MCALPLEWAAPTASHFGMGPNPRSTPPLISPDAGFVCAGSRVGGRWSPQADAASGGGGHQNRRGQVCPAQYTGCMASSATRASIRRARRSLLLGRAGGHAGPRVSKAADRQIRTGRARSRSTVRASAPVPMQYAAGPVHVACDRPHPPRLPGSIRWRPHKPVVAPGILAHATLAILVSV